MTLHTRLVLGIAILAAWLGAALLLASAVAPAVFDVLGDRTLAGAVVGRVLPVVFVSGIVAGLAGVWCTGYGSRTRAWLGAAIAAACALAQFSTAPRIARLRDSVGSAIETLSPDDPRRVAFGRLHMLSVGWLALAIVCAAVLLILSLRAHGKNG